ncbi:MAG: hypothetical protein JWM72_85 [Actinomycetia bacterium]|jgi:hypothetical protein|nr:hypothetical protein [Actinomycetes bacterium]
MPATINPTAEMIRDDDIARIGGHPTPVPVDSQDTPASPGREAPHYASSG